eukprot:212612_1
MIVEYLFEKGSKITKENAEKILNVAVEYYKGNNIMEIMDKCVERYDRFGTSDDPLYYALLNNQPMIVEYLFEKGSKITKENAEKILNVAVEHYEANNIMEIMDKCLKVNHDAIHDRFGTRNDPLYYAL